MGVKLKFREDKGAGRRGKWWVYVYHRGKEKAKCVGTDEKLARDVARKIQAKLTLGDVGLLEDSEAPRRPFDAYFQGWLDTYVRAHCKDSTYAGYETAFRLYLKPQFEQRDISGITRDDVKRLAYDLLNQPKQARRKREQPPGEAGKSQPADQPPRMRSRSYVKGVLAPLSEMFNHAIEDGHFAGINPALRVLRRNRIEEGARQEKANYLTGAEAGQLLAACREHFAVWHPFVLSLVMTGMRIGEAVALQWADVDFSGRFAEVKRNLVDGKLTTPKSGKMRRVDVSAQLTETLRTLLVERKKETLRRGWGEMPAWVFINDSGNPVDPDNFRRRVWPKVLAKAELRQIRIHDLRHTYASLLIQQGESLTYVKEQMGHHSIRVTVDTYGHLVPGGNKAAVDRLDTLIHRTKPDHSRTSDDSGPSAAGVSS